MKAKFQVRLEVADGYTYVTVFSNEGLIEGDWDEMVSVRLDRIINVPNALYDIAALAHEGDGKGLQDLYATFIVGAIMGKS